jgi:hypothetical protein
MSDADPTIPRRWLAAGLLGAAALPVGALAGALAGRGRAQAADGDVSGASVSFPGATRPVSLSEALRERCSLRSFGAALDGKTDDSPAVARAVAYARANNVPVFHPGGACLMGGAAGEIDTSGVAFAGIGIGDFAYPYGHVGSQFWITDRGKSPFRLGGGGAFDGVVFFWPEQVDEPGAPKPYPPLFSAAPNTAAADITIRNCQVTNAFDFLSVTAPGAVAGHIFIANCRIFALRRCFDLTAVPEVLMLENNLFSFGVYQNEVLHWGGGGARAGDKFYLRDYVAGQGCWCRVSGDGTPAKASTIAAGGSIIGTNNYIFGYRYGVRVEGGICAILRLTSTHFDGVATVLAVEPGGTLIGVQILGSLIYAYQAADPRAAFPAFLIHDPAPESHGAPDCQLAVTDCEIGFAAGALFEIAGPNVAEVKIADCKLTRYANTDTTGLYHALRIAAPHARLTFANNDVWPARTYGSGVRVESVKWASITGNTFDGCLTPVHIASRHGRVLLATNLSEDTRGPLSVNRHEESPVLDAANAWDKPGPA